MPNRFENSFIVEGKSNEPFQQNNKSRHRNAFLHEHGCLHRRNYFKLATAFNNANVQTTATASKNTVGVADPFNVTIEAVAPEGVTVRFPEVGDRAGDFEITNHRDTMDVPSPQGRKYQRQLTLETLKTGDLSVPEFEVFFKDSQSQDADAAMDSVKTAPIPITVQTSITGADNPSQFRDIKNVVFLGRTGDCWLTTLGHCRNVWRPWDFSESWASSCWDDFGNDSHQSNEP